MQHYEGGGASGSAGGGASTSVGVAGQQDGKRSLPKGAHVRFSHVEVDGAAQDTGMEFVIIYLLVCLVLMI